jgi:hypothetical protein
MCTILSRNQRTDQGSLDPGSVHQIACLAVSCIRPVSSRQRSRRGATCRVSPPSWDGCVQQAGWTASSWAMPSRGPTYLRVLPRGFLSGRDALAPLRRLRLGRGILESCPSGAPEGALEGLDSGPAAPTPCGATRPLSGGRHIGEGHWVGIAEKRPLFGCSGRQVPWRALEVPKAGEIRSASGRTQPLPPGGGSRGPVAGMCAETGPL